jgi:hypothetical protein
MLVIARPQEAPVMLVERPRVSDGCSTVLVFREGLLAPSLLALLQQVLSEF